MANSSVLRVEVKDGMGYSHWVTANLVDLIADGCGLALMTPLPSGSTVVVRGNLSGRDAADHRKAGVRWCVRKTDGTVRAGLQFLDTLAEESGPIHGDTLDLYEVMQLSPHADAETIARVYRLLAFRYHPDNAATGNAETFMRLREACEILSDPEKRAAYDAHRAGMGASGCGPRSAEVGTRTRFDRIAAEYLGILLDGPRHGVSWEA